MTSVTPTATLPRMAKTARPKGVTIVAILSAIGSVFAILFGVIAFVLASLVGAVFGFGFLGAAAGGLMILLGVGYAVLSYGLFTQKTWAWYLAVGLSLIGI